ELLNRLLDQVHAPGLGFPRLLLVRPHGLCGAVHSFQRESPVALAAAHRPWPHTGPFFKCLAEAQHVVEGFLLATARKPQASFHRQTLRTGTGPVNSQAKNARRMVNSWLPAGLSRQFLPGVAGACGGPRNFRSCWRLPNWAPDVIFGR